MKKPMSEKEVSLLISEKFNELKEQNRNVFFTNICNQVFMYRSLKRNEFRNIVKSEMEDEDKQDLVCEACVLYPENYDFNESFAGIVPKLSKEIIENSFLDSLETRTQVLLYYRQEMFDIDNQINCIINEAFPQHDIETIDSWDLEQTSKYLANAEWKLTNLRGLPMHNNNPYGIELQEQKNTNQEHQQTQEQPQQDHQPQVYTEEITDEPTFIPGEKLEDRQKRLAGKKKNYTQEEIQHARQRFPEIDWEREEVGFNNAAGLGKDSVSTVSPALRTPDQR